MEDSHFPPLQHFETLFKYNTEFSADSVEWCPHDPNKNIFVCGNYQLGEPSNDNTTNRLGRILLFALSENHLTLCQSINTEAILDQKWCPNQINGTSLLGVVNAKRALQIYRLENSNLILMTEFKFSDSVSETLILSLDWSTAKYESQQPHITCSDSNGNIHLLQLQNDKLVLQQSWHGHSFQAWIAGFYYWDPNIVFSGGDDAVFLKFDKRIGDSPVAKNREHDAGVTSFHSNKSNEFIVVSGSYDENIRLWDIRNIKNSLNLIKMPGPLWRLKWDPFIQKYLLAASMLGGVHIIKVLPNKMEIVDSYYEHKNIAYGADWSFLEPDALETFHGEGNVLVGSCSFYDQLVCISKTYCDLESNY
ncbi:hypothetical protein ABEB36_008786 [Hypothenemus hampei]|uniref:methylated diphthine methylhydrolase n=1 Tax=Hypothenemus hampei TaxID=57062 RepID=A0ABD1ENN1_HYPHA